MRVDRRGKRVDVQRPFRYPLNRSFPYYGFYHDWESHCLLFQDECGVL